MVENIKLPTGYCYHFSLWYNILSGSFFIYEKKKLKMGKNCQEGVFTFKENFAMIYIRVLHFGRILVLS